MTKMVGGDPEVPLADARAPGVHRPILQGRGLSPMNAEPAHAQWHGVTAAQFQQEIVPAGVPAVLRGVGRAVAGGRRPVARRRPRWLTTSRHFSTGATVHLMVGDPSIGGTVLLQRGSLTGVNFEQRVDAARAMCCASLLKALDAPAPPALYAGAISIPAQLPGFARDNSLDAGESLRSKPRSGSAIASPSQTHFDMSYNVACVVAGRRRFTLIPPEQLENMYVGPLEFTLAGPPISMVRLEAPDLEKYPALPPTRWPLRSSPSSNPATRCSFRTCGGTTSSRATDSTCWSITGGMTCPPGRARRSGR